MIDKDKLSEKNVITPSEYSEVPHQLHAESSSAAAKSQAKLVANNWDLQAISEPEITLAGAKSQAWADTPYFVQELKDAGAWLDWRSKYKGGHDFIGRSGLRPLSSIKWVVDHHTVTNPTHNAKKDVDTIAHIHLNVNRWGGIGYNYIITSEVVRHKGVPYAKVVYIGDISTIRAHTPNYKGNHGVPARQGNYYTLGIATIGAFHQTKRPSKAQYNSSHLLHEELIMQDKKLFLNGLKHRNLSDLREHKDFDSTACAGHFDSYSKFIIKPPMEDKPDNPCEEYQKRIQSLEEELERSEGERRNQDQLLADAIKRIDNQKQNIQRLMDDIADCEHTIAEKNGELHDLRVTITELHDKIDYETRRRWATLKREQSVVKLWQTALTETIQRIKKLISNTF